MAKMQNVDRLKRRLALVRDTPRKAMTAALQQNADELVAAMKSVVPKKTHALEKSIGWSWGNAPGDSTFATGGRTEEKALLGAQQLALTVHAGDKKAYWARWVEFGTRAGKIGDKIKNNRGHSRKVKRNHPGTEAQPFFFPTYRLYKKRMLSRVSRAMRKAIKQSVSSS